MDFRTMIRACIEICLMHLLHLVIYNRLHLVLTPPTLLSPRPFTDLAFEPDRGISKHRNAFEINRVFVEASSICFAETLSDAS